VFTPQGELYQIVVGINVFSSLLRGFNIFAETAFMKTSKIGLQVCLFVQLCFWDLSVFAQSFESLYALTQTQVFAIVTDNQNNTYAAGYFLGTVDFNSGPEVANLNSANDGSLFLLKLDSAGDFVFAKKLPYYVGRAELHVDSENNIYVSSSFYGAVDLNPGTGSFNVSSLNGTTTGTIFSSDVYLVKLNSAGDFVWGKRYGTTFTDSVDMDLTDQDEMVIALTYMGFLSLASTPPFSNNAGQENNIALFRLDTNGNIQWVKDIGADDNVEWTGDLSITQNGDILIGGVFAGTTDLDPGPGLASYTSVSQDVFIARYDEVGNFMNVKIYGGPGNQNLSFAVERDNCIVAEIKYDTQLDADAGNGNMIFAQDSASRVVMLKDSIGFGLLWATEVPFGDSPPPAIDEYSNRMVMDEWGNIYCGYALKQATQVMINGSLINLVPMSLSDGIVCKISSTGNIEWFKRYGLDTNDLTGIEYQYAVNGIALKAPNHVVFGGVFAGSCDFDLGTGEAIFNGNQTGSNGFIVTLELVQDPGDLDGDGEVTTSDVYLLLSNFGCYGCSQFDFNADGIVNINDVILYMDILDE
jgi:hypothetical protein